jgi:hypothetical protein
MIADTGRITTAGLVKRLAIDCGLKCLFLFNIV